MTTTIKTRTACVSSRDNKNKTNKNKKLWLNDITVTSLDVGTVIRHEYAHACWTLRRWAAPHFKHSTHLLLVLLYAVMDATRALLISSPLVAAGAAQRAWPRPRAPRAQLPALITRLRQLRVK